MVDKIVITRLFVEVHILFDRNNNGQIQRRVRLFLEPFKIQKLILG